jgi:hypothetical protein
MWSRRHPIRRVIPWTNIARHRCGGGHRRLVRRSLGEHHKADTTQISALNLWFADLPTEESAGRFSDRVHLFLENTQRWEGRNYSVAVSGPSKTTPGMRENPKNIPPAKRGRRSLD